MAESCKKHGKHWGLPVTPETAPKYMEMGARFLSSGADVLGLGAYLKDLRARFHKLGVEFEPKI